MDSVYGLTKDQEKCFKKILEQAGFSFESWGIYDNYRIVFRDSVQRKRIVVGFVEEIGYIKGTDYTFFPGETLLLPIYVDVQRALDTCGFVSQPSKGRRK